MTTTLESLRWNKFPALDDGFICLVDAMGDDASVVQAARVSYGKDVRIGPNCCPDCRKMGYWKGSDVPGWNIDICNGDMVCRDCKTEWNTQERKDADRTLIRYLMRHRHTTPFEMAELKFLVRVPMDCWRQWVRHRMASINEYSTRYTTAIDSAQKTPSDKWRSQSKTNKQGSAEYLPANVEDDSEDDDFRDGHDLTNAEEDLHRTARWVYEERIKAGVAREQARKDLPLSTYTEAYWKIDLHNLLHFLGLRMDSHAQQEIREYATIIGEKIVKPLFPMVWEAFEDYRLGALHLTRLDQLVIMDLLGWYKPEDRRRVFVDQCEVVAGWTGERCRERDECKDKLTRLGVL